MAIGNGELMHECLLKHSRMITARMKKDKETDKEGKKRRVRMKTKQNRNEKKEIPTAYHYIFPINNNKHNKVIFNKKLKKYNEIQLTKNKMDLNNQKMKDHPASHEAFLKI